MKNNHKSFVLNDQRGQSAVWVAFTLTAMLGMAGLTIDVGHAYVVRSQLQSSANAAALSASAEVYNTSSTDNASSVATTYSGQNTPAGVTVTTTVTTPCLNVLMPGNTGCTNSGGNASGSSIANAVRVKQTASVPMYFMKIFGVKSLMVGATATASMQGEAQPWNVAIIVDGTGSMGNSPGSSCSGYSTRWACAMAGIQSLLQLTNPCPPGVSSCTTSNANFRVSLFMFPNLSTSGGFVDTNTCGSTLTYKPYTLPTTSPSPASYSKITYTGSTAYAATYQVTDWDSGYYKPSSTSTQGLNTSDNLVKAIGHGSTAGCLTNIGGESSYFTSVIYAAQAALLQEQAKYPGSQNAMIILTDGEAQAVSSKFPTATSTASNTTYGISVTYAGSSTKNLTGATNSFGIYPDYNDECQQAIVAARAATNAGTRVYAAAFGSTTSGCIGSGNTDTTLVLTNQTGLNAHFTLSQLTPCLTMEDMASSLQYFYADSTSASNSCTDSAHSTSTVGQIFNAIAATFTTPRLLPNNAT